MNVILSEEIDKIAERLKKGEAFFIIFPEKKDGKKKYTGWIASKDGRTVQFWNRTVRAWESFSLYELLHIFKAKIQFME